MAAASCAACAFWLREPRRESFASSSASTSALSAALLRGVGQLGLVHGRVPAPDVLHLSGEEVAAVVALHLDDALRVCQARAGRAEQHHQLRGVARLRARQQVQAVAVQDGVTLTPHLLVPGDVVQHAVQAVLGLQQRSGGGQPGSILVRPRLLHRRQAAAQGLDGREQRAGSFPRGLRRERHGQAALQEVVEDVLLLLPQRAAPVGAVQLDLLAGSVLRLCGLLAQVEGGQALLDGQPHGQRQQVGRALGRRGRATDRRALGVGHLQLDRGIRLGSGGCHGSRGRRACLRAEELRGVGEVGGVRGSNGGRVQLRDDEGDGDVLCSGWRLVVHRGGDDRLGLRGVEGDRGEGRGWGGRQRGGRGLRGVEQLRRLDLLPLEARRWSPGIGPPPPPWYQ